MVKPLMALMLLVLAAVPAWAQDSDEDLARGIREDAREMGRSVDRALGHADEIDHHLDDAEGHTTNVGKEAADLRSKVDVGSIIKGAVLSLLGLGGLYGVYRGVRGIVGGVQAFGQMKQTVSLFTGGQPPQSQQPPPQRSDPNPAPTQASASARLRAVHAEAMAERKEA